MMKSYGNGVSLLLFFNELVPKKTPENPVKVQRMNMRDYKVGRGCIMR